jgi:hypothetical protein
MGDWDVESARNTGFVSRGAGLGPGNVLEDLPVSRSQVRRRRLMRMIRLFDQGKMDKEGRTPETQSISGPGMGE